MRSDGGLMVRLDTGLPSSLPVGRGTAIFCSGACFHSREAIRALELVVDGEPYRPAAWRMPRLDLFELSAGDARWYRTGFWAIVPIDARDRPGTAELTLRARLARGRAGRPGRPDRDRRARTTRLI